MLFRIKKKKVGNLPKQLFIKASFERERERDLEEKH